ncbi:competence protein CoiA family protein [Anaeromicropila herbilytica]|uniref:Competence protein CoiA-like family protein n=1 Tax=Anaeromicropila herbilytica TaxID=2785025 RepID=A0A7R7IEL8_9FIRM|nr:competence protein CoiA family protein [Anaeromicropila herbilytica]BCN31238.1 hypothetical protein bsdtb5_25330 [Anaeromicropila herbilytica]
MEYAMYKGSEFCSFSLKDNLGYYDEELRKQMRIESQTNAFTCNECKEYVILNAGPILPPYFSHHKGSKCTLQNNGESKEHREGRFLLYLLAKRSFPKAIVRTNTVHENGRRTHVYIEYRDTKIAINYISSRLVIKDWEEKHSFYEKNNIIDVWVLNIQSNIHIDSKNVSLTSYLTSSISANNKINLLDTNNKRMTLVQFLPRDGKELTSERVFNQKSYKLEEMNLNINGEFYSESEEHKKLIQKISESQNNINNVIIKEEESDNKIMEYAVISESFKNTFLFKTTNMYWKLPTLIGTSEEVKKANARRLDYFIQNDNEIKQIKQKERKEKRILEMKSYIELRVHALDWIENSKKKMWR